MVKVKMEEIPGLVWRVVTQDCAGGKALNTIINLFCAAVLIYGAPKAWDFYWQLRDDVSDIKGMVSLYDAKTSALLDDHGRRITIVERSVADHAQRDDERFDRVNDRLTRVAK